MKFKNFFKNCCLCPRKCKIDRTGNAESAKSGFCGESHLLKIGYIGPHFGEEPPISGVNGSGTIFFSGCPLKCSFCQNYQISRDNLGEYFDIDELYARTEKMITNYNVININFVTPDHFLPYIFQLVIMLRENGYQIPLVYNTSGYQSIEILNIAQEYTDIYLPDYKYSDPSLARHFSKCPDYPVIALEAITRMIKQKGFLDSDNQAQPARKGVLVRHLILPGYLKNSLDVLSSLFLEFGPDLPISLMSQYSPVIKHKEQNLNRALSNDEFMEVYQHAGELGFRRMFIQFPEKEKSHKGDGDLSFLPDFSRENPFAGIKPSY